MGVVLHWFLPANGDSRTTDPTTNDGSAPVGAR
jgi:hypothetical protein